MRDSGQGIPDEFRMKMWELVEDLATAKASAGRRAGTVYDFRLYTSKWLTSFGDMYADELHYKDIRAWWGQTLGEENPAVANKTLMTLRSTIQHAIRIGARREGNPAKALIRAKIPPKREAPRLDLWSFHKIVREIRKADKRAMARSKYMGHASYFLVMAALAARGNEVCGIEWGDVDFEQKQILLFDTKTAPSLLRQVSDLLLDEIEAHLKRMQMHSPKVMSASPYVFPRMNGTRANALRPRVIWAEAVESAGFVVGRDHGWTPHDVRRLGIELLYEAGGEQRDVMQYVGHHVAMVHAMYLQKNTERLSALAERTNARLFAPMSLDKPTARPRPPPGGKTTSFNPRNQSVASSIRSRNLVDFGGRFSQD